MPRGQAHPKDVRAHAIADLISGDGVALVAERYDVPIPTVKEWQRSARRNRLVDDPQKKATLGELVYGYLETNLRALATQAQFSCDEDWLRKQDADSLAILHGVLADKAVRLLAALEPANDATDHIVEVMATADLPTLPDG